MRHHEKRNRFQPVCYRLYSLYLVDSTSHLLVIFKLSPNYRHQIVCCQSFESLPIGDHRLFCFQKKFRRKQKASKWMRSQVGSICATDSLILWQLKKFINYSIDFEVFRSRKIQCLEHSFIDLFEQTFFHSNYANLPVRWTAFRLLVDGERVRLSNWVPILSLLRVCHEFV